MSHPIPDAALDGRIAIVGISGSGKSTTAKGGVERLLSQQRRVCVVDLLDGWWGLRVKRNGKTPAYPVAIFGGLHGDLPLNEHAGALIGQTVAESDGSSIVSLSELSDDASRRRFALAFFQSLHKHSRAPLHLVIDEADFYAPQQPVKEGPGPLLLNRVKEIAARGRMRGFRCWLITQRPAKLHKDALSQADTLIAMQLTSSQDRQAIEGWIGDQGDRKTGKDILASLPALKRGHGVLWAPRLGILGETAFPLPETYDSSRTPEYGEELADVELKPLDLGKLKERLSTVEAETKANDPKALRAQLATLTRERDQFERTIDAGIQAKSQVVDKLVIEKAEERGEARGYSRGASEWQSRGFQNGWDACVTQHRAFMDSDLGRAYSGAEQRARKAAMADIKVAVPSSPAPSARPPVRLNGAARASTPKPAAVVSGDGTYSGPQRKVLLALAMWRSLGHDAPSREMVAAVAGYSPSSGGFNNLLGGLKTSGAVDYPQPGFVTLLLDGVDVMSKEEGRNMLLNKLANPQKKIIAAVVDAGTRTREEIANDTGYSSGSGGYNNLLGSLRTLGIVDYPQQGSVAMSPWAQELLSGCGTGLS